MHGVREFYPTLANRDIYLRRNLVSCRVFLLLSRGQDADEPCLLLFVFALVYSASSFAAARVPTVPCRETSDALCPCPSCPVLRLSGRSQLTARAALHPCSMAYSVATLRSCFPLPCRFNRCMTSSRAVCGNIAFRPRMQRHDRLSSPLIHADA